MSIGDPLIREKLEQVPKILDELGLDAWMLFSRESATVHDPSFDLVVGSLDKANVEAHGHYPEIVTYVGGITEDLRKVLGSLDPQRIAINFSANDPAADGMTHGQFLA